MDEVKNNNKTEFRWSQQDLYRSWSSSTLCKLGFWLALEEFSKTYYDWDSNMYPGPTPRSHTRSHTPDPYQPKTCFGIEVEAILKAGWLKV